MRSFYLTSFFALCLFSTVALAQEPASATSGGFTTDAQFAILKDFDTGETLYEKNADQQMVPSSMTKMMTTYIVFQRIREGKLKLTDAFPVSEKAWRIQGSKMFVELGNTIKVDDLLHGVIVQSGNDACIVLAEGISGSEQAFAVLMTETAKRLGMNNTVFKNASGWPEEGHYTTARDLSILADHIIRDDKDYYNYYSKTSFTYHGITQGNRNLLLYKNIGVDGLKTGHTEVAGYGITVSGKRGNRRLIAVINGLKSEKARADESAKILEYGFSAFENYQIFPKDAVLGEAEVWYGKKPTVQLVAKEAVIASLPRASATEQANAAKAVIHYQGPLKTPINAGDKIAELELTLPGQQPRLIPLYAKESIEPLSFFERIIRSAKLLMQ